MNAGEKVPTKGGADLSQNPFAQLSSQGLPALRKAAAAPGPAAPAPAKNRGRVDIIRETGNRAGKTVIVVSGFVGIGHAEKEQLARRMRTACGCGGTVKDGRIEIQGEQRETVAKILAQAGFQPVFAGG
jgi:translation initiation factor 1